MVTSLVIGLVTGGYVATPPQLLVSWLLLLLLSVNGRQNIIRLSPAITPLNNVGIGHY